MNNISSLNIFGKRNRRDVSVGFDFFDKAMKYVMYFGPECMPPGKEDKFNLEDGRKELYTNLIYYFYNDQRFQVPDGENGWKKGDLNGGLFISGGKGNGKTIMMKVFTKMAINQLLPRVKSFNMARCTEIVRNYEIGGVSELQDYWKHNWCFDDLGDESKQAMHFGTPRNVMREILTERYNTWTDTGDLTFLTSNSSMKTIADDYGVRVQDRFWEMFNIITINKESLRKNK